jgi:hypothetical protein
MRKAMLAIVIGIFAIGAGSNIASGHNRHHGFKSDDFAQQDACVFGTGTSSEEASPMFYGPCDQVQLAHGGRTIQIYVVPQD